MPTTDEVFAVFATADGPLKTAQVAEILGVEKKDLAVAMKELKAEGKLVSPKQCFYTPAQ
ncbi:MAG: transcriptional regulator [Propionibacteriaceae bacterium]|nr:transcriptional regulator [Propionibacteriaceae bacterium]